MTHFLLGILFYILCFAGFSQQKKNSFFKTLNDSCFQPGDVLLFSFLSQEKTGIEVDYVKVKQIGRFLRAHKSLQVEILFKRSIALNFERVQNIETSLKNEIKSDSDRFSFSFTLPKYPYPNLGAETQIKLGEIPTEIKILKPLPFPYKNPVIGRYNEKYFVGNNIDVPVILYDFSRIEIRPESKEQLKVWAEFISAHPEFIYEVAVHTDSRGAAKFNDTISSRRARAVREFLVNELKIPKEKIYSHGYGEQQLLCEDIIINTIRDKEGKEIEHQKNRRTELRIIGRVGDCDFFYEQ